MTFRLSSSEQFEALRKQIDGDQRLTVEVKRETQFYADQSEMMAKFIKYLGMALSVIFSLGAIIGAMITMYTSVANRIGEIGTLRALGFQRASILSAFLVEAFDFIGFDDAAHGLAPVGGGHPRGIAVQASAAGTCEQLVRTDPEGRPRHAGQDPRPERTFPGGQHAPVPH